MTHIKSLKLWSHICKSAYSSFTESAIKNKQPFSPFHSNHTGFVLRETECCTWNQSGSAGFSLNVWQQAVAVPWEQAWESILIQRANYPPLWPLLSASDWSQADLDRLEPESL